MTEQLGMPEVLDKTKINNDNYVVKANKFIEAKGRLTTMEQKILATLISMIDKDDEEFKAYKVKVKDFGELINYHDKTIYKKIKELSTQLSRKEIKIEGFTEKGEQYFEDYPLVARCRYIEGDAHLSITLNQLLKPYLLAIKGNETPYTKYMLRNILLLNSPYSIRLYELLKQYQYIGKRTFDIDQYRALFEAEDKYPRFQDFEKRLIKDPVNEINGNKNKNNNGVKDIRVNYEKIKKGRKVVAIEFNIETIGEEIREDLLYSPGELKDIKIKTGLENEPWSDEKVAVLYSIAVQKTMNEPDDKVNPYDYIRINYNKMCENNAVRKRYGYLKESLNQDFAGAVSQMATGYFIK